MYTSHKDRKSLVWNIFAVVLFCFSLKISFSFELLTAGKVYTWQKSDSDQSCQAASDAKNL